MKRAAIIVLDSVGIGELPDAAKYGDEGSNTLVNIKRNYPSLDLKNMSAASYFAAYASTSAFLLFTDRLSGKQSRLTATIPIFIFGILFIV